MSIQKRIVVGGGTSLNGITVYFADGSSHNFDFSDILENYDSSEFTNWFINFGTSGSTFGGFLSYSYSDTNPKGELDLYDGDASANPPIPQSFYSLPIYLNSERVNLGGVYRENIFCAGNKGPIVEITKIA